MSSNIKNKSRIVWIDNARTLCILGVICAHCFYNSDNIRAIFVPFVLSVFFFLAGYVYNPKYSFKEFMTKKVKTILAPWLIYGLINIIMSQILTFNQHTNIGTELLYMFLQIRGKSDVLWFLPCLFISFVPFFFLIKYANKKSIIITFILSLISIIYVKYTDPTNLPFQTTSLPWHIQIIFVANFFMVLGYYYKEILEPKISDMKISLIFCLSILYIATVYINYYFTKSVVSINIYDCNILLWYLITFLGVTSCIYISKKLPFNRLMDFTGKNSILYFCLHGKALGVIEKLIQITKLNQVINMNIFSQILGICFITLMVVLVLIIPIKIINKYLSFTIGKKNSVSKNY